MNRLIRLISCVLLIVMSLTLLSPALADSESSRIEDRETYTIETRNKDATLTIKQTSKGKAEYKVGRSSPTRKRYGAYQITVLENGYYPVASSILSSSDRFSCKLKKDSSYTVEIVLLRHDEPNIMSIGVFRRWKTAPKVKVSVNKSAKIR